MIKALTRDMDKNEVPNKSGVIETTRRPTFKDDRAWLPQGARGREIYIGRGSVQRGVPRSKWANPFVMGVDGSRRGVFNLFRDYAWKTFSEKDLSDIRGKCLVCHCRFHETCHGDVVADMARNPAPTKESELLEDGLPMKTVVLKSRTDVQKMEEDRTLKDEAREEDEDGGTVARLVGTRTPETLDVHGEAEDLHRWRRALLHRTLAP